MLNMAGCVVLYNPPKTDNKLDVIENIKTYLPVVKKLYVMDNSTKIDAKDVEELKQIKKVEYISMNGNKGIAKALKDATELAIKEKFDYILTMDQDSKYPTEDFGYIEEYIKNNNISNVAQIGINFGQNNVKSNKNEDKSNVKNAKQLITSGTITFLDKYKQIEGYNEGLFIDGVDFDVSYQFRVKGFDLLIFNNIFLQHNLGTKSTRNILGLKITRIVWNPVRQYYLFRNDKYFLTYKSPKYLELYKNSGLPKINKFLMLDRVINGKPHKLIYKMIKQGIQDGKAGILGPYQERPIKRGK